MIELGDKVKDGVSGFTGIVTARTDYINKCVRFEVSPAKTDQGKLLDAYWFDEEQLIVVKKSVFKVKKEVPTGGPARSVARRSTPSR